MCHPAPKPAPAPVPEPSADTAALVNVLRSLQDTQPDASDRLADRLAAGQGPESLLGAHPLAAANTPAWEDLLSGRADLAATQAAYRAAKRAYRRAHAAEPADAATLWLLLSLAAARVHHRQAIGTVPPETVHRWLTFVGGATDSPVTELLCRAADAASGEASPDG